MCAVLLYRGVMSACPHAGHHCSVVWVSHLCCHHQRWGKEVCSGQPVQGLAQHHLPLGEDLRLWLLCAGSAPLPHRCATALPCPALPCPALPCSALSFAALCFAMPRCSPSQHTVCHAPSCVTLLRKSRCFAAHQLATHLLLHLDRTLT